MNPVIIEDTQGTSAGVSYPNIIASNASLRGLIQAPFPARGKLLAVATVTGLLIDFDYGSKNVVSAAEPRVATFPEDPIDVINDEFYVNEGDQLALRVTNPTGGAITIRYRLILFPLVGDDWTPGTPFDMSPYPDTRVMQKGPVVITNGTVDSQLLDGLRYERMPVPCLTRVLMSQSAIGMTRQMYIDQDRIAPPSTFPISNRVPQDPFDSSIEGIEVPQNALQQLQVTNLSGGSLNVFWKTKMQETYRS